MSIILPGQNTQLDFYESKYTPEQVEASIGKGIIIQNQTFWTWDVASGQYVDTGVIAGTPSNRNLLDNAYFIGGGSQQGGGKFPINQRGLTTYLGGGYCIDRWYARAYANDQMTTTLESDGLLMTHADGAPGGLVQRLECPDIIAGKVVTISFLLSVNTVTDGFDIGLFGADQVGLNSAYLVTAHVDAGVVGLVSVTGTVPENFGGKSGVNAGIYFGDHAGSIKIHAAKLELGPHQTLAHESAGGVDPE